MKYDTLVLMCNTSNSSGVVWTLNVTKIPSEDWEFNYVYVNGSIVDHEHRHRGSSNDKGGGSVALVHSQTTKAASVDVGDYTKLECLAVKLVGR